MAVTPMARRSAWPATTSASTRPSVRSTTARSRAAEARAGPPDSAAPRPRWPGGWATSAGTSRRPWSRCSSATPSSGSTSASCCSNRSCSESSSRICTSSRCSSSSIGRCRRRRGQPLVRSSPRVLAKLEERLADRTRQAVRGALARASRTGRPRPADIDWTRTIRANLRHFLPEHAHAHPRSAHRLRPPPAQPGERRHHRHRPERLDGRQRRPRLACSPACWPACRRCARPWSPSTPPSPTSRRCSPTPSTCCSASSSAAGPTSGVRWRTAAARDQPPTRNRAGPGQRPVRRRRARCASRRVSPSWLR